MSYILDALKRAESERSRGAIPNLHAQPGLVGDGDASGPIPRQRAALLAAVAVLLVAAAVGWWVFTDGAPPTAVVGDATPSATPSAAPSAIPPAAAPVATASMPTPALAARPAPSPVLPVPNAPAKPIALPWFAQKAPLRPPPPSPVRANKAEPAVPEPPSPAASAGERIYALKELPDNIRSSLPVLTVGGATYSENAASRMLIVNGNLFHEGDKLTPEVTLHQIKLRAAVLSFRGYRYSISY